MGTPNRQRESRAGKEHVNSNNEATGRVVRMWKGGPLRQMAPTKVSGTFIPYGKTINGCSFAGRYVCDECQQPCGGISLSDVGRLSGNRHSKWLCDRCRTGKTRQPRQTRTPEQRQAAIDRLAAARRDRTAKYGTDRNNVYDREMKEKGSVLIDARIAGAVPTAGQPNLGTEEHEQ